MYMYIHVFNPSVIGMAYINILTFLCAIFLPYADGGRVDPQPHPPNPSTSDMQQYRQKQFTQLTISP